MAVTEAYLQQIKDKVPLLDVVNKKTVMGFRGGRYWGLCPFHVELTPSFTVTPEKGVYYCFGCHKGGGLFQFVMDAEQVSFGEAVERLAKIAGISPLDTGTAV